LITVASSLIEVDLYRRRVIHRPFSMTYYLFLLILLVALMPSLAFSFREILVSGLGLPPEAIGSFLMLSLIGSFMNVPVTEVQSRVPMYRMREVRFFGVGLRVPRLEMGIRRTVVTINVGGAILPLLVSLYLLFWSIPIKSPDPLLTYLKVLFVLAVETLVVYRSSRLIPGLGIATPAFVPPVTVALATAFVHIFLETSCPTQIAYIGGTLGTLIGADLLNMGKISELGAPMVSIGGAGTFDGIYTTGLISVLLVLILT
jgi:uncharacterized membrane protein